MGRQVMEAAIGIESLDRALAAKLPVTLLAVVDGTATEVPAKFLKVEDGDTPGMWVQPSGSAHGKLLDQLAKAKASVRGTFCDGGSRLTFATVVEKRDRALWLNETTAVEAVLLQWPDDVTNPEMRQTKRHRVTGDRTGLTGRLFYRDRSGTREVGSADLWDISTGGASFVCLQDQYIQAARRGDPFAVVLNFRGRQIMLPARYTHARAFSSRSVRVGMRFDFGRPAVESARADLERVCETLEAEEK